MRTLIEFLDWYIELYMLTLLHVLLVCSILLTHFLTYIVLIILKSNKVNNFVWNILSKYSSSALIFINKF